MANMVQIGRMVEGEKVMLSIDTESQDALNYLDWQALHDMHPNWRGFWEWLRGVSKVRNYAGQTIVLIELVDAIRQGDHIRVKEMAAEIDLAVGFSVQEKNTVNTKAHECWLDPIFDVE